jgi:predicted transcriptional regulator
LSDSSVLTRRRIILFLPWQKECYPSAVSRRNIYVAIQAIKMVFEEHILMKVSTSKACAVT